MVFTNTGLALSIHCCGSSFFLRHLYFTNDVTQNRNSLISLACKDELIQCHVLSNKFLYKL